MILFSAATIAAGAAAGAAANATAARHRREKEECTNNWQDTDTCHARCEYWKTVSSTPIGNFTEAVTQQLVNECTEIPVQMRNGTGMSANFDLVVIAVVVILLGIFFYKTI